MRYVPFPAAIGLLLAALWLRAGWCVSPPGDARSIAALVPLVHVKASSDMAVEVAFDNTSSRTIKYLQGRTSDTAYLTFLLRQNGRVVGPLVTPKPPPAVPSRVQELKPGRSLLQTYSLRATCGALKPGRYLLTVEYFASESGIGLTPLNLEQRIYVVIEK